MIRRGFVLVAALWLLVALAALGLSFGARARTRRLAALNALDASRARAAAEAGLATALDLLAARARAAESLRGQLSPGARLDPWGSLDTTWTGELPGGDGYDVTLQDPGARLDVNAASDESLRRYFAALGLADPVAETIADGIADWRDADDLPRGRGAERADYLAAGSLMLPRNGPFASVEELRYVHGMTDSLYAHARADLTVNGSPRLNLLKASRPVLLTLPGIGEAAVELLARLRQMPDTIVGLYTLAPALPAGAREVYERNLPTLAQLATMETPELDVLSRGFAGGSGLQVTIRARVRRIGPSPLLLWRQTW